MSLASVTGVSLETLSICDLPSWGCMPSEHCCANPRTYVSFLNPYYPSADFCSWVTIQAQFDPAPVSELGLTQFCKPQLGE